MLTLVYPDAAILASAASARLLMTLHETLAQRDTAHVVLTGGTIGIATLAAAAASPLKDIVDWTSVHVWWGDERFVPRGDPDRNDGQADEALLAALPLSPGHVHRVGTPADHESAEAAAAAYAAELTGWGDPSPTFDVLMLGLGPDAHVASLFPGHPAARAQGSAAIAVRDSPKPPPTRVSLTLETINRAREVWVIAAGESKAEAVHACFQPDAEVPGAWVRGTERTLWLLDVDAAARL